MKATNILPEGYKEFYSVNLLKDKKTALIVNSISLAIAAVMVVPMLFIVPITSLFSFEDGVGSYTVRFAVLLVSLFAYIILHELVHGAAMKLCGTKKVKFGFTGLYAFAGSEDYYCKKAYIFIALAPLVLWGVVLGIILPLVSVEWFWVVYIIQILNLSGAAGDLIVTVKFSGFSKDILIRDYGVGMTVFSKE